LAVAKGEHKVCVKDCYLNLSTVQKMQPSEIAAAVDDGPISATLRARIVYALNQKIPMLSTMQRDTILKNL
jgi:hypothetical protein